MGETREIGRCITVVLPTLNEASALPKVVEELRSYGLDNILVVDGGSTDGTIEIARRMGLRVVVQEGKGKGNALKTALKYVDTPYIAFMDADYSYPPRELRRLLRYVGEYDLVLGARRGRMALVYRVGNAVFGWLFRTLFGVSISDPLTGMYLARRDLLKDVAIEASGFDVEVDILAKALSVGARIVEVPVEFRERIGAKKLRPWHAFSILSKMLSLAYRLNPSLSLSIIGSLLLIPGLALGGWVAYRFFYVGIPHYMLGLLALALMLLGTISLALIPLAASIVRLQAAVFRASRSPPPECRIREEEPDAYVQNVDEQASRLELAGGGSALVFVTLLATSAYFAGLGDFKVASHLSKLAYYALFAGVVLIFADFARRLVRGREKA